MEGEGVRSVVLIGEVGMTFRSSLDATCSLLVSSLPLRSDRSQVVPSTSLMCHAV